MPVANSQQWRMWKKILVFLVVSLLSLLLFMWATSTRNQPSSSPELKVAPNAVSSNDNQLVETIANECSINEINAYPEAESMSAEDIFRYLHWTNSTSCLFAVDFGFAMHNGGGIYGPDGHKAVCLDKSIAPVYNKCLVYSFGINNIWSFDEAMEQFGCHVYSFDPSMGAKDHNRTEKIHFYNIGLSGKDGLHPSKGWNMKTASSIYEMLSNNHGSSTLIDVLKMDIEFSEWEAIPQMLRSGFLTDKVKQLAVEIHFDTRGSLSTFQRRIKILQNLEAMTGTAADQSGKFVRFSSRPNPWCLRPITILGGKHDYFAMELAWYNSKYY